MADDTNTQKPEPAAGADKSAGKQAATARVLCMLISPPEVLKHRGTLIHFAQVQIGDEWFCASEEIPQSVAAELYQIDGFAPFTKAKTHGDFVDKAIADAAAPKAKPEQATIESLKTQLTDHQQANLNLTADVKQLREQNEKLGSDNTALRAENAALKDVCAKSGVALPKPAGKGA